MFIGLLAAFLGYMVQGRCTKNARRKKGNAAGGSDVAVVHHEYVRERESSRGYDDEAPRRSRGRKSSRAVCMEIRQSGVRAQR